MLLLHQEKLSECGFVQKCRCCSTQYKSGVQSREFDYFCGSHSHNFQYARIGNRSQSRDSVWLPVESGVGVVNFLCVSSSQSSQWWNSISEWWGHRETANATSDVGTISNCHGMYLIPIQSAEIAGNSTRYSCSWWSWSQSKSEL